MDADGWDAWLTANLRLQDSLGDVDGQTGSLHLEEEPQVDNSATMPYLMSAPFRLGRVMRTLHIHYLISFKCR